MKSDNIIWSIWLVFFLFAVLMWVGIYPSITKSKFVLLDRVLLYNLECENKMAYFFNNLIFDLQLLLEVKNLG